jgi:hypothetical protein
MFQRDENMPQKIDLEKLDKRDWEKYKRMGKVARDPILYYASMGIFYTFLLLFGFIIFSISSLHSSVPYAHAANFTLQQFTAQIAHLNLSANMTNNSSLLALINVASANPKFLATAVINQLTLDNYLAHAAPVFGLFALLILMLIVFMWLFPGSGSNATPSSFRQLERIIRHIKEGDDRLYANNYTKEDIEWYHAVRRAQAEFTYLG